jgi:hypothetical protein
MRDNQNSLKDRADNSSEYTADEVSDYTTSSTSFVDVDGTNFSLTLTTQADSVVLIGISATLSVNGTNAEGPWLNVSVDAVDEFGDDGITMHQSTGATNSVTNVSFVIMIEDLAAGSHTFNLRWKSATSRTSTLYAGAGTGGHDVHPQFWAKEI